MRTIDDADHGRNNNFNLLRMVAAATVLISHAWLITRGRAFPEPLEESTGYTLGIAGVVVFFAISGFFITKSFDRRSLLANFIAARASRVFPGLVIALFLTAFVLGPAFTTLSAGRYFREHDTWIYLPQNALLIHQQFALPGVFTANPFGGVVNASLWTLKYEVGCYAGVVLAGHLGLLRPKTMPLLLLATTTAMLIIPGGNMTLAARIAVLCGAFSFGAAVYVYRALVPISFILVAALMILAVVSRETRAYPLFYAASLGYAALACGFADIPPLRLYNRIGDYSYGIYIYAFPIGQAARTLLPMVGPWGLIAATFPLSLLLAILSWTCVEKPALVRRHRLAALLRLRRSGRVGTNLP